MNRLNETENYRLKLNSQIRFVAQKTMLLVLAVVFAGATFAQTTSHGKRSGGWGTDNTYNSMYNTKSIETITGEVISVEKINPVKGMSSGVHLMVKTKSELISVHVGPEWFIDNQDIEIVRNDMVKIKGSRITFDGQPAIIASQITKGNNVLLLRSRKGYPVWSGWRQR